MARSITPTRQARGRPPRGVRRVRGGGDRARRRAIGAGPVGAARRRARLHDREEVSSCRRPTCCARRAGGAPCRCGRRRPPRSSCWPPAPAIANVQVKSGPDGFSVTHRLDAIDSSTTAPRAAPLAQAQPSSRSSGSAALVALEQQLRSEIRSTREPEIARRRAHAGRRGDDPARAAADRRQRAAPRARARAALHRAHARHEHAAPRRPAEHRPRLRSATTSSCCASGRCSTT